MLITSGQLLLDQHLKIATWEWFKLPKLAQELLMFGLKLVFMLVNGLLQVMIDYFTFTIKIIVTFTKETVDTTNRKLKTSSRWSRRCLSLNFASFSSSGHVCDFDDTIRSTSCKRLMWWWKCALIYIYTKKCARGSAQPRSRDLGIWTNQQAGLTLRARAIQNYCLYQAAGMTLDGRGRALQNFCCSH